MRKKLIFFITIFALFIVILNINFTSARTFIGSGTVMATSDTYVKGNEQFVISLAGGDGSWFLQSVNPSGCVTESSQSASTITLDAYSTEGTCSFDLFDGMFMDSVSVTININIPSNHVSTIADVSFDPQESYNDTGENS